MFKDIKGYEGIYQISTNGEIRRISYLDKGNKGKYKLPFYLKVSKDKDGYKKVTLTTNNKPKQFFIHRLVALTFIKNNFNKKEVNHIDGNKGNSCVENLEWVTQSENRQHCLKYLNPKLKNNKLSKKVYQYDFNGNLIKIYPSAKQVLRDTGFSQGHVSEVCRGVTKTYKGFIWKYE